MTEENDKFAPRTIKVMQDAGLDWEITLPEWLAQWDVWTYWEKERILSMLGNLKKGDVLFDIGAEHGWMSVLFGKYMVGPENMVLVEPTAELWPNIKQIWEMNFKKKPRACFPVLIGDEKWINAAQPPFPDVWPLESNGENTTALSYTYLHETSAVNVLTIDLLTKNLGAPAAITIDIEGAELLALKGAVETIKEHKPLIWLSEHPDLQEKHYGVKKGEIRQFMADLEYNGFHLGTDHEEHWFYRPM